MDFIKKKDKGTEAEAEGKMNWTKHKTRFGPVTSELRRTEKKIEKERSDFEQERQGLPIPTSYPEFQERFKDSMLDANKIERSFGRKFLTLNREDMKFLIHIGFERVTRAKYPNIDVSMDIELGELWLEGPGMQLEEALITCTEIMSKITRKTLEIEETTLWNIITNVQWHDFFLEKLAKKNLQAKVCVKSNHSVTIVASSAMECQKAQDLLYSSVIFRKVEFSKDVAVFVQTTDFQDFLSELEGGNILKIRTEMSESVILLASVHEECLSGAKKKIEDFLKTKQIQSVNEKLPKGVGRFLKRHFSSKVKPLEESLEEYNVSIKIDEAFEIVQMKGRKEGLVKCKKLLSKLYTTIIQKDETVSFPGLKNLILEENGKRYLDEISVKGNVDIMVKSCERRIIRNPMPPPTPAERCYNQCNFTSNGIKFSWKYGRIEDEKADVLVNSAHSNLNDLTACTKALNARGGPSFVEACKPHTNISPGNIACTTSGNLACTYVIHAVCSYWNEKKMKLSEKLLRGLVKKIFEKCIELGVSSLAMPAIGTGQHRFPENLVLKLFREEIVKLSASTPSLVCLKEIRVIIFKPSPKRRANQAANSSTSDPPALSFGSVRVFLHEGDITQHQADAIINVLPNNVTLSNGGGVCKSIIKAGGQNIQQELANLRANEMPGSVFLTNASLLQNVKKIIHCVPTSTDVQGLEASIEKCFNLATQQSLDRVSIPAIGTASFNISPEDSAVLILKAAKNFSNTNHPLDISIVVFPKTMVTVFQTVLNKQVHDEAAEKTQSTNSPSSTTTQAQNTSGQLQIGTTDEAVIHFVSTCQQDIYAAHKEVKMFIKKSMERKVFNNEKIHDVIEEHFTEVKKLSQKQDVLVTCSPSTEASIEGMMGEREENRLDHISQYVQPSFYDGALPVMYYKQLNEKSETAFKDDESKPFYSTIRKNIPGSSAKSELMNVKVLDEKGGVLEVADVKLTVPANALQDSTRVGIRYVDPVHFYQPLIDNNLYEQVHILGHVLQLSPAGQRFRQPISLKVILPQKLHKDEDITVLHGSLNKSKNSIAWKDITSSSSILPFENQTTITLTIEHFSYLLFLKRLPSLKCLPSLAREFLSAYFNFQAMLFRFLILVRRDPDAFGYLDVRVVMVRDSFHLARSCRMEAVNQYSICRQLKDNKGFRVMYGSRREYVCRKEQLEVSVEDSSNVVRLCKQPYVVRRPFGGEVIGQWTLDASCFQEPLSGTVFVKRSAGQVYRFQFWEDGLTRYVQDILNFASLTYTNMIPLAKAIGLDEDEITKLIKETPCDEEVQLKKITEFWERKAENCELMSLATFVDMVPKEELLVSDRGKFHLGHLNHFSGKWNENINKGEAVENELFLRKMAENGKEICQSILSDCYLQIDHCEDAVRFATDIYNSMKKVIEYVGQQYYPQSTSQLFNDLMVLLAAGEGTHNATQAKHFCHHLSRCIPWIIQIVKDLFKVHATNPPTGMWGLSPEVSEADAALNAEEELPCNEVWCQICEVLRMLCERNLWKVGEDVDFDEMERTLDVNGMLMLLSLTDKEWSLLTARVEYFRHSSKEITRNKLSRISGQDLQNVLQWLQRYVAFCPTRLVQFTPKTSGAEVVQHPLLYCQESKSFTQTFCLTVEEGSVAVEFAVKTDINGRQYSEIVPVPFEICEESKEQRHEGCTTLNVVYKHNEDGTGSLKISNDCQKVFVYRIFEGNVNQIDEEMVAHRAPREEMVAHRAPREAMVAHRAPREAMVAHRAPREEMVAHRAPREAMVAHRAPREEMLAHRAPREAMVAHRAPREAMVAHRAPREEMVAHRAPREEMVAHRAPREEMVAHRAPREEMAAHRAPRGEMAAHRAPLPHIKPFLRVKEGSPSQTELREIARKIPNEWRQLGRRLLSSSAVDDIDTGEDQVAEKATKMLEKWKESKGSCATYENLYHALCSEYVSRKDIADEYLSQ